MINLYPDASVEDRERMAATPVDDAVLVRFRFLAPLPCKNISDDTEHKGQTPETTHRGNR